MLVLFVALLLLAVWAWSRISELNQQVQALRRELERLSSRIDTFTKSERPVRPVSPSPAQRPVQPDLVAGAPTLQGTDTSTAHRQMPASPPASPAPQPVAAATMHADPVLSPALERELGTNWLNKLGAFMLVVGVAFFLTYQLRTLGPLGKDLVGVSLALALLAGGIFAERRTDYRIFSRGLVAAGWGLLFFLAFAVYHVPAAKILESRLPDLGLMLLVAAGMVLHAVRYRSQIVTGLALLFAFGTVAISHETAFTLPACVVLAASSALIALSLRWYAVETGAIVGTYVNHWLWMPALTADGAGLPHNEYVLSLALLAVYWATFRLSYVVRRDTNATDERWSALAAVLNTGGLVVVAGQHRLDATTIFLMLLSLATLDAVLAYLVRRRRRAFATLTTLATAGVAMALPFEFSGKIVSIAWIVEAEALVVIGVLTRDGLFTRLGVIGSLIAGWFSLGADVAPLAGARVRSGSYDSAPSVAAVLAAAATVYYVNSLYLLRKHAQTWTSAFDRVLADKLSYAGALAACGALWALLPLQWLAPGIVGLSVGLVAAARRLPSADLWIQGECVAFLGALTLASVNFADGGTIGGLDRRIITVLMAAAGHHAVRALSAMPAIRASASYGAVHGWIGSAFIAMLVRKELDPPFVAIAWAALVLLTAVAAQTVRLTIAKHHMVAGTLAVCAQAVTVNIYGSTPASRWWDTPMFTVGLCAALLLATLPLARRMRVSHAQTASSEGSDVLTRVLSDRPDYVLFFAPLGLLAWLLAVHARGSLITMTWGFEAVGAFLLALWLRERAFRLGALSLLLACVLRIVFVDVWQLDQQGRYIAFIALGSTLLLVSFLYSRYRALLDEYL